MKDEIRKRKISSLEPQSQQTNLREYICSATESITIKFVRRKRDFDNNRLSFHPKFTHQLFERELIHGYKDLSIKLFFTVATLNAYMEISFSEKHPDPSFVDDIEGKILRFLKAGVIRDKKTFLSLLESEQTFVPFGKAIDRYYRVSALASEKIPKCYLDPDIDEKVSYEVRLATFKTPGFIEYHDRMQFFLLLYIDASSFIDSTDSIWKVLCFYELRHKIVGSEIRVSYLFAGYCTLYSFYCFPDSSRLRISQILILPPFQRSGHGSQILKAIYDYANRRNYYEVNIEDPSDGFQFLRDLFDIASCEKNTFFEFLTEENFFDKMSEDLKKNIKKKLKITDTQIIRCFEALKFKLLDLNNEVMYKAYRLEVKKRLYTIYNEELSLLTEQERKSRLSEIYFDVEKKYSQLLLKLYKPPEHVFREIPCSDSDSD